MRRGRRKRSFSTSWVSRLACDNKVGEAGKRLHRSRDFRTRKTKSLIARQKPGYTRAWTVFARTIGGHLCTQMVRARTQMLRACTQKLRACTRMEHPCTPTRRACTQIGRACTHIPPVCARIDRMCTRPVSPPLPPAHSSLSVSRATRNPVCSGAERTNTGSRVATRSVSHSRLPVSGRTWCPLAKRLSRAAGGAAD